MPVKKFAVMLVTAFLIVFLVACIFLPYTLANYQQSEVNPPRYQWASFIQTNDALVKEEAIAITSNLSHLPKFSLIQNWIADNVQYNLTASWQPPGVTLDTKQGNCISYSILFTTMCRDVGYNATAVYTVVGANATYNVCHAYNWVEENGQWYTLDPQVSNAFYLGQTYDEVYIGGTEVVIPPDYIFNDQGLDLG